MTNPLIKIVDVSTGEELEREMSSEEFAQYKLDLSQHQAKEAEKAAKEAARQTALEKLAALGLTPEEISAITGA